MQIFLGGRRTQRPGARVQVHETFRLEVDDEGVLRCDHNLRMWAATAVRLHYKLLPDACPACPIVAMAA